MLAGVYFFFCAANLSASHKGPEVVDQAVRVLELVSSKSKDFSLSLNSVSIGVELLPKGLGIDPRCLTLQSSPSEELESMLTASPFRTRLVMLARLPMRSFLVSSYFCALTSKSALC